MALGHDTATLKYPKLYPYNYRVHVKRSRQCEMEECAVGTTGGSYTLERMKAIALFSSLDIMHGY